MQPRIVVLLTLTALLLGVSHINAQDTLRWKKEKETILNQLNQALTAMSFGELEITLPKVIIQLKETFDHNSMNYVLNMATPSKNLDNKSNETFIPYQAPKPLTPDEFDIACIQEISAPSGAPKRSIFNIQRSDLDKGSFLHLTLKTIYFQDGTKQTQKDDSLHFSHFSSTIITPADSITMELEYTYPEDTVEVILTAENPIAWMDGDSIKLERIDHNLVYFTMNQKTYSKLQDISAQSEKSSLRPIEQHTGLNMSLPFIQKSKILTDQLSQVSDKIKNKEYTEKESLKNILLQLADQYIDKDLISDLNRSFWRGSFNANVQTLKLIFATNMAKNTHTITLPVTQGESMLARTEEERE